MEFSYLSRPMAGESCCGDGVGVFESGGGTLFAVLDGLGHGPEAFHAVATAIDYIGSNTDKGMEELVWGCHEQARRTRGLALFLCRIWNGARSTMECAGVGNIEFKSVGPSRINPFSIDGIVGHRVRKVTVCEYPFQIGDIFAIFTDGLHSKFDLGKFSGMGTSEAAQNLLNGWGKDYDDATVLVIRV